MRGLLVVAGLLPACTSGMSETTVVEQGACTALEGRTFVSGEAQLAFDVDTVATSRVSWFSSDRSEVGQVNCVGRSVTATIGNRTIRATFDPQTLRLTWAGETFVAQ